MERRNLFESRQPRTKSHLGGTWVYIVILPVLEMYSSEILLCIAGLEIYPLVLLTVPIKKRTLKDSIIHAKM